MVLWIEHNFPKNPADVPLRKIEKDPDLIREAGGNPGDFEFQCWELTATWGVYPAGYKVVTGRVAPGYSYKVRVEE